MQQRPKSTFGLLKHLVQLRWQKLGHRGRTLATIAGLALALSAFAAAGSCMMRGCLMGGCPYSQQAATQVDEDFNHPVLEVEASEDDVRGYDCPHSRPATR